MNQTELPRSPDIIECYSDIEDLKGRYEYARERSNVKFQYSMVPDGSSTFIYENVGRTNIFLGYFEGIPELLPADIWVNITADALSHHADANLSAAVSQGISNDACYKVCEQITQIARDVSHELAGWLFFRKLGDNSIFPLARCVQRLSEDHHRPVCIQYLAASWEVRESQTRVSFIPEWIRAGLKTNWMLLATQPGVFKTDCSISLKGENVSQSALLMYPIPLDKIGGPSSGEVSISSTFAWNLGNASAELDFCKRRETTGFRSASFRDSDNDCFSVEIRPSTSSGLISVALVRMNGRSPSERDTRFRMSLGGSRSGTKLLVSKNLMFTVLFDPRLVFQVDYSPPSLCEQADLLKKCTLLIEFIGLK